MPGGHQLIPPDNCPEIIKNLMVSCWQRNPEDRPDFTKVVSTLENDVEEDTGNQFDNQTYGLMDELPKVNEDTGYIEVISGAT